MKTDETLEEYKARVDRQELKRARGMALIVSVSIVITLISIVYGLVMGTEVNNLRQAAEAAQQEVAIWKERTEEARSRAERAEELARQQQALAVAQRAAAEHALLEAKSKK